MSKPTRFGYPLDLSSAGMTIGNLNLTGQLFQNGAAFSTSQWTTTAGNVSYTSGSVIVNSGLVAIGNSNTVGNLFTTGGNVGIGTSSPGARLDVSGNLRITSGNLIATGNSNTVGSLFTTGGNVSIGTNTPSARLHVLTSDTLNTAYIENTGGGGGLQPALRVRMGAASGARNILQLENGGGIEAVFRDDGFVGIGTSSPGSKLHVRDTVEIGYGSSSTPANEGTLIIGGANGSSAWRRWQFKVGGNGSTNYNTNRLRIIDSNTERMTIDESGNVGIATNSPTAKLHVNGSASMTAGGGYFWQGSSIQGPSGSVTRNVCIYAQGDGWIYTDNGFLISSDRRIKTNIIDINDDEALQKIRLISPKKYEYIDKFQKGSQSVYGFIAQDIEQILPEATSHQQNIIPSIYSVANVNINENGHHILVLENAINDTSQFTLGTKIQCFDEVNSEFWVTVMDIPNNQTIVIEETIENSKVFVYGQKVNDFVALNKDYIWTVATAALQEVDRQLQVEKQAHQETKQELANLKAALQAKFPGEF